MIGRGCVEIGRRLHSDVRESLGDLESVLGINKIQLFGM
jgi:hypothetical protein